MKIAIHLLLIFSTMIPTICQSMETEPKSGPRFQITAETIKLHEKAFRDFLQTLEKERWPKMQRLPDPDTLIGSVIIGGINLFTKPLGWGEIEPKTTEKFLRRALSRTEESSGTDYEIPPLVQQGIQILRNAGASHADCFGYMNQVVNQLDDTALRKGNLTSMSEVMKTVKPNYPNMPGVENMDTVPREVFAPFAAAQLFVTCCVEKRLLLSEAGTTSRHPHNRSAKTAK